MGIVVASVPAGHVYVRHLAAPNGADRVRRLPDPPPKAGLPAGQWWPPRMLETRWVQRHAAQFDLMHIHFGFDAVPAEALAELVAAVRRHGKPLVLTVHDLRNPHHADPALHEAQLEVLVRGADAIITLTGGAAAELARQWARHAIVLPHPHVVDEPALSQPRPAHDGFVVGVHCKSLRANMDPLAVVEQTLEAISPLPGATLRVDAHTDIMTPGFARHAPQLACRLRGWHAAGLIDLRVHDYFSDEELWEYLLGIDVSVLPYRFGTHSGWLEACYDLGTTVLAPDCGFYAEQRPCLSYRAVGSKGSAPTLAEALNTAYHTRPRWRASPADRRAERAMLASRHETIYAGALARRRTCVS